MQTKARLRKVDDLFAKLRPSYTDLTRDFGATELFLLDGEALLLETISNPHLDWNHGGAWLHFFFLAERYLSLFTERGGNFQIIFFDNQKSLWNDWFLSPRHKVRINPL